MYHIVLLRSSKCAEVISSTLRDDMIFIEQAQTNISRVSLVMIFISMAKRSLT